MRVLATIVFDLFVLENQNKPRWIQEMRRKSLNSEMSEAYKQYVTSLESKLEHLYAISRKAREKGLDPALKPECDVAKDLADLVEGLVGPKGVAEGIRELSTKLPREELAFKIAEEIVYGKFGHMETEAAAEQAVRTALAILTEGLTAAPLQGVAHVKIKTNNDRTKYLAIYFAGPIRSAGGTDQALTLVIGDFVRRLLGLDRYKPTEEEIARFIEEVRLYERSVSHFQYHVSDEELRKPLQWLPVEVTGTESDPIEVSSFRNLLRIETNRVRGGALRVVNDGIVGRSAKVWTIIEKLGIQGWDWLKDIRQTSKEKKSAGFMKDVIAGRPIFSFPSRRGGFRLRYGRARNTGLAAVGIHPATMYVLQSFLAAGTQLRLELPGKGGIAVPVDTIECPIVRLRDGSVDRVSVENFSKIKDKIEKILFLGDILISFGDFLYNSKPIPPSGYVEEWWIEDLKKAVMEKFKGDFKNVAEAAKIPLERLKSLLESPFVDKPNSREAIALSLSLHVPLHPYFTFFWASLASLEELELLRNWLVNSEIICEDSFVRKIVGKAEPKVKKALETICLPHKVLNDKIVVEDDDAHAFAFCLGYNASNVDYSPAESILEAIKVISGVSVREKAPTFVGARMGRPEKAKRREMKPLVHVLFPVGLAGGSRRDVVEAAKREPVFVEVVKRKCPVCKTYTFRIKCPECGAETVLEKVCPRCGRSLRGDLCPICKVSAVSFEKQVVNFKGLLESTCSRLGVSVPKILKGVKGLINESKTPETIEKGVFRAKYDLSVYKDGTIRFDATNAPLTHFKPSEIGVSVDKLRHLGYTYDVNGAPLTNASQICELKIQDVVIPRRCAEYFIQVANFIDELLTRVYGLSSYYNVKSVEDLVGRLVVGLAPHTCVGILGRIVGFTNLSVCYAHPVWHSAKRRDCDGDEDALMLALDTLINFSREYLPAQIGGIMDAPLLLIPGVNTKEVQRQVHEFDVACAYPVEFYEKTWENVEAKHVSRLIDLIEYRLGTEAQFEGFSYTTPVSNVNLGNPESAYKRFKTMIEKLNNQLELAEKIEAVDAKEVALKVLTTHFIRDIAGNLRAFSTQGFRCKSCNRRFRRLPLRSKCPSCGGALTLTVYRGGIEKYLDAAQHLIEKYGLPQYYAQRILLVREEINALFDGKKPKQISLVDFV
jgi:DNA polymerase II large subunit